MRYGPFCSTKVKPIIQVASISLVAAIGLFIAARAQPGSVLFYVSTLLAGASYWAAWLAWGVRRATPRYLVIRQFGRGLAIGLALLAIFVIGAFLVQNISILAEPVRLFLDNARRGPLLATVLLAVVTGAGEEVFFRRIVMEKLPGNSRSNSLIALALYVLVTAATGIALLAFAAVIIGAVASRETQATKSLVSAVTLHLTWSVGLLFILPQMI